MSLAISLSKKLKIPKYVVVNIFKAYNSNKKTHRSIRMDVKSKKLVRKLSKTLRVSQKAVIEGLIASITKSRNQF